MKRNITADNKTASVEKIKIDLIKEADGIYNIECNGSYAGICKYTVLDDKVSLNDIVIEEEYCNKGICTAILKLLAKQYAKPIVLSDCADKPGFFEGRGFRQDENNIKKCGLPGNVIAACNNKMREHNTLITAAILT